jgi:hypothetical protein
MKRLALTMLVAASVAACSAAPTPAPPTPAPPTPLVIYVTPAPFVAPATPVMVIPTPQSADSVRLQHLEQELTTVNQKLDAICKTLAEIRAQTNTSGVRSVPVVGGC